MKKIVIDAIKEYNKYRAPEAVARLFEWKRNKVKIKFEGPFCKSCGFYDYFDDFKILLKDRNINVRVGRIKEIENGAIVEFKILEGKLINTLKKLKKSRVKEMVEKRIEEFKEMKNKSNEEIFKELCFCILTANFNAEKSIKIQEEIGDGFLKLPEERLAKKLKDLGHRYPKARARYIVEARRFKGLLKKIINSYKDEKRLREWFVKNVKGLGYKEASHFLRNIGFFNLAILDFHILDVLEKNNLIEKPKALTKKRYLEIEGLLEKLAKKLRLSLAELDLYLWYTETGKILK